MGEFVLPITLGLVAVSLGAVSIGLGVAWHRAKARIQQTQFLVDEAAGHETELSASIDALTVESDTLKAAQDTLKTETDALRAEVARLNAQVAAAHDQQSLASQSTAEEREHWTEQLASVQNAFDEAIRERDRRAMQSDALKQQLESSRADAARQTRDHMRLLRSLGLDPSNVRDPIAPEERLKSRSIVRQLLVSSGSEAAALVKPSGLVAFCAGRDAAVQRLGVAGAIVAHAEAHLTCLLGAPLGGVSIVGPRFAQHLVRVHGSDLYLAVENMGDAPQFALRHARLQLVGKPGKPTSCLDIPDHFEDLMDPTDEKLVPVLNEWATRWSARSVTVTAHDDRPAASTASADRGAAAGLRERLGILTSRAARDRMPLDSVSVTGWAEDGTTIQITYVHSDSDATALVTVASAPLPDRALRELQSTVRWHLSTSTEPAREAS